jgi:apoptosis-inducing factor 2
MSKNIVVVGNGFAGSQSAVALRNGMGKRGHKITIISPFDYCEVPMNMGQVLAAGAAEHEKVLFPAMKENGIEYVQDSAKELTPDKVITSNGTEVPFDVCIIATGQCNPVFMPDPNSAKTRESRVAQVSALHEKIVAAKNIVLSGGGPVGSETAADIKLRYPDKT